MAELSPKELMTYLRKVTELETSIYCMTEARARIRKEQRALPHPKEEKAHAPLYSQTSKLHKPECPEFNYESDSSLDHFLSNNASSISKFGIIASVILFIFGCLYDSFMILVACFILAACIFIWFLDRLQVSEQDRIMKNYQERLASYEAEYKKAELADKAASEQYYAEKAQIEARYAEAEKERAKKIALLDQLIWQINESLLNSRDALGKMYDLGYIYPKYRNMIAISTIYEYFLSGRCTTLTGPDGAYNLYESELRQNIIIEKLNVIITHLEQIKQNQYVLYSELQKTNRALDGISRDVKGILNETLEIGEAVEVTKQCAIITAQNSEALKYIALMK